jgi:Sec-independent protein translocase protein TatA
VLCIGIGYYSLSSAQWPLDARTFISSDPVFARDSMSSMKQAKKYTAQVNEHQISAKKLAKAAKFRARAAKIREQVAKHDAKIRSLQRKIADLERRANQLAGPPMR